MAEVVIVDHDPRWPQLFAKEAEGLRQAFGVSLIALEHIGSTSVPGLAAKPIIDIQAVLGVISDVDKATSGLAALGWERGVFAPDPERHLYFKKHDASGTRTHQLHVYEPDHPAAAAHRLFRDYLRADPDEAARYQDLKRHLARLYRQDGLAYSDAKTQYVLFVLAKAQE